jgi:Arm DNA-binding domain
VAIILTATAVRNARPGFARRELPDASCPGLNLSVEPSGTKRWTLRYRRPDGRSARLSLGSVYVTNEEPPTDPVIGGHMTLASARRLVAKLRHEIAQGRDPGAAHLNAKRCASTGDAKTFGGAARDFIEQHAMRNVRRWQEQSRLLGLQPTADGLKVIRGGLADSWSDKPIGEISGDDIFRIVDRTRERGALGLKRRAEGLTESRARAMYSCLSKMFAWLIEHRRIAANPCAAVHRPETPAARDRVLDDAEIVKFWRATDNVGAPFGTYFKVLLLTGCRLNEVAGMRRSEMEGTNWNIPGGRTKKDDLTSYLSRHWHTTSSPSGLAYLSRCVG